MISMLERRLSLYIHTASNFLVSHASHYISARIHRSGRGLKGFHILKSLCVCVYTWIRLAALHIKSHKSRIWNLENLPKPCKMLRACVFPLTRMCVVIIIICALYMLHTYLSGISYCITKLSASAFGNFLDDEAFLDNVKYANFKVQ